MAEFGVKRDGSYYTEIIWASHTESDPQFWVCNIISDDNDRNGGTWGSNTFGPVELVLGFAGEKQKVSRIKFYRNVGITISKLEELAKRVKVSYIDDLEQIKKLRTKEDDIESIAWKEYGIIDIERDFGWQEVVLDKPFEATYIRFTLMENDSETIDWCEMNEIKLYEE